MESNRHQRFRCLLCPDTAVFDNETSINLHSDHPKQPLISDELLLAQFGTKADEPEYNEINVFNCPYCDRQRLSISTLYDHLTLEHLDVPFSVRCPVCVCFRGHVSIPNGVHLTKHLAEKHCSTLEQYQAHITVYKIKPSQRMCSICLELVGEHNCRELTCRHKFHAGCIDPWTAQNATCPVCRTAVT
ncbi:hypothetical protein quinque_016251 [Culex quinquefasciatus]